jgi:arylsulfatase A-like enzyme
MRFLHPLSKAVCSVYALTVLLGLSPNTATAQLSKANIVFIMVDDLGKEWIASYGGENVTTPNIDRLAEGGMRFLNVYSMPQCTPTRATLLTGQYPFRHGWVNHWDVPRWGRGCHFDPKANPSVARVVKAVGYNTCVAGKWQINDFRIQPDVLNQLGFDEYCMWTGYEAGNPASGKRYWDPYIYKKGGSKTHKDKFGPDICNDFVLDFLDRQSRGQPFFVYYPMILTHGPLTTTPHKRDVTGKTETHTAMVEYMDHLVGKVVAKLDETGLRKDTIVIWTTDNGTSGGISNLMNGRLVRGAKGKTLENGTCEPFVVNCPGIVPAGKTSDALIDFTDLLPTFASIAGSVLPEGHVIDGKSFSKVIFGRADDGPRKWILSMGGGAGTYDSEGRVINIHGYRDRVIRNKRYKLYVETDRSSAKLVDLEADPAELKNQLDNPKLAKVLAELEEVEKQLPPKDAAPRYSPLPKQPWDVKQKNPGQKKGLKGLPSNDPAVRRKDRKKKQKSLR